MAVTAIDQLIQLFARLPGLGPRSARRLRLRLLQLWLGGGGGRRHQQQLVDRGAHGRGARGPVAHRTPSSRRA